MAKKLCSLVGKCKRFEAIYYLSFRSGTLKTAAEYSKTAVAIYAVTPEHHNTTTNFAVISKFLRAVTMYNKTIFGLKAICQRFGVATAPVFLISFQLV